MLLLGISLNAPCHAHLTMWHCSSWPRASAGQKFTILDGGFWHIAHGVAGSPWGSFRIRPFNRSAAAENRTVALPQHPHLHWEPRPVSGRGCATLQCPPSRRGGYTSSRWSPAGAAVLQNMWRCLRGPAGARARAPGLRVGGLPRARAWVAFMISRRRGGRRCCSVAAKGALAEHPRRDILAVFAVWDSPCPRLTSLPAPLPQTSTRRLT